MTGRGVRVIAVVIAASASCSDGDKPSHEGASPSPVAPNGSAPEPLADGGAFDDGSADAAVALGSCAGPAGKRLRTLFVGNSQIYYWDLPKLLSDISESAPAACPRIDAEGFTRGGQNLHRLWTDGDALGRNLATVIGDGRYDVVVVAESIDLVEPDKPPAEFPMYANLIIDAARASGAVPVLYATPYPDQEGHRNFVEMAAPQLALGKARSVAVAAGGLAWLRVWQELPEIDLHHTDNAHPGHKGSYISAMVIYAAITRATPIGLTSSPPFECRPPSCPPPPITAQEASIFQLAAWDEARATSFED